MSTPQELRHRLVAGLRAGGVLHDERVAAALTTVPRHVFLPGVDPEQAYADDAVVTKLDGHGRPVSSASQPAIIALMLEQLDVRPGQRILEIGAGTGYNAALLAALAGPDGQVTTVDLDEDTVAAARTHLAAAGDGQVSVVCADGGEGWPPGAPYDRIILTVGAWDIAPAWAGQLTPAGRLVLPLALRAGLQYSIAFDQAGDHLRSGSVLPCGFMALRGAFAGPVTTVPRRDGTGTLAEMAPPPDAAADLETLLSHPGQPIGGGVQITVRELYDGLGLWLAAREPGLGRLYPSGPAEAGPGPAPSGPDGRLSRALRAARRPGATMLTSPLGCAAVIGPGGRNGDSASRLTMPFEAAACPFGPDGVALAVRLISRIRDWNAAGRPGRAQVRISAYPATSDQPAASDRPAAPGQAAEPHQPVASDQAVITRPHTRLLVGWM